MLSNDALFSLHVKVKILTTAYKEGPTDLRTRYIPLTSPPTTVSFIHSASVTLTTSLFLNKAISRMH